MPTDSPVVFGKLIRQKERVETRLCLVSEFWKPANKPASVNTSRSSKKKLNWKDRRKGWKPDCALSASFGNPLISQLASTPAVLLKKSWIGKSLMWVTEKVQRPLKIKGRVQNFFFWSLLSHVLSGPLDCITNFLFSLKSTVPYPT